MNKKLKLFLTAFLLFSLLTLANPKATQSLTTPSTRDQSSRKITAGNQLVQVDINVTAPAGPDLAGLTPIVVPLSDIASSFPASVDAFGTNASSTDDDVKWDAAYVTYNGALIPSQVDDLDDIPAFSEDDELVFALPESVTLSTGESAVFSVYFSLKDLNLPPPFFPEVCTVEVYPDIQKINDEWPDMLGKGDGVYWIGNEMLRAAVLKAAAWSTGGLYHVQLLDEQGESRWDIVKQKFPYPSEIWKWSRFALIDQFAAQNEFADRPYPGKIVKIISGPVRARMTIQSTQPYVYGQFLGSTKPINGLFGLFTYDLFANQTYIDYSLELTGPSASNYSQLALEFQSREWGGGRAGTLYKAIYVPGHGWEDRSPDDTAKHIVAASAFNASYFLETLHGDTVRPASWYEPDEDPYRGFGLLFDETGFSNISWDAASESLSTWFEAAEFPFRARYHPFDKTVLGSQTDIAFMESKHKIWVKPNPALSMNSSLVVVTEIPFDYLFVDTPAYILDENNSLLHIENITAFATDISLFISETSPEFTSATYQILSWRDKSPTGLEGALTWDDSSQMWGAANIDISSISIRGYLLDIYYVIVFFETTTLSGRSAVSDRFGGGPDILPPSIGAVNQVPAAADIIRKSDNVTVSADVIDYEGEVSHVILSFSNGTSINGTISNFSLTMKLEYGLYRVTIPPHKGGTTVKYKIIAYDDASPQNFNVSEVFSYFVTQEYIPGQGLVPLAIVGGVLIVAVVLALKSGALHRLKYDQVD